MKCPFCGNGDTRVIDSRAQDDQSTIRRRRVCDKCEKRFTTYERIDSIPINVIKNNGTREIFDREKLIRGVMQSCNKRPVTLKQIEGMADDIENYLNNNAIKEISSKELGNMVMDRLKVIDEVAYVRFASVYRQFKDLDTFMNELERLVIEKRNRNQ